jgi:hypothetical protein
MRGSEPTGKVSHFSQTRQLPESPPLDFSRQNPLIALERAHPPRMRRLRISLGFRRRRQLAAGDGWIGRGEASSWLGAGLAFAAAIRHRPASSFSTAPRFSSDRKRSPVVDLVAPTARAKIATLAPGCFLNASRSRSGSPGHEAWGAPQRASTGDRGGAEAFESETGAWSLAAAGGGCGSSPLGFAPSGASQRAICSRTRSGQVSTVSIASRNAASCSRSIGTVPSVSARRLLPPAADATQRRWRARRLAERSARACPTACVFGRNEPARRRAAVGDQPRHGVEDVPLCGAAGLRPDQAS